MNSATRGARGSAAAGFGGLAVLAVAVIIGLALLFSVTWGSTGVKEIGLHYSGGPIEGQEFVGIIPPGQPPRPIGLSDDVYKLPNNQRTYITSKEAGGDSGVLTATNADGNKVEFETSMTFLVPTDPEVVRPFFEDICTKYDDCSDAGWDMLLDDYLRKVQETTLQSVSRSMTSEKMAQDPSALSEMGQTISDRLPEQIKRTMGGPYFEVSEFQVNNLILPDNVLNEYEALTARKVETQQANEQAKTAAELEGTLNNNPEYLTLRQIQVQEKCVENGSCSVVYVPQGSDLMVQQP